MMKVSPVFYFSAAELSNNMARGLYTLALGMLMYQSTGSLWAFAFTYISEFIVTLLLQGIAGTCVDKFKARKVLVVTSILSVAAIGVLIQLFENITEQPIVLGAVMVILQVSAPFVKNAVFSLVPEIASSTNNSLEKINGSLSIVTQSGQIIGMLITGIVVEVGLVDYIVHLVAVLLFLSIVAYLLLFNTEAANTDKDSNSEQPQKKWSDVLFYIKNNPSVILFSIICAFDFIAIACFNLLLAPAVAENFDNTAIWLSIIDVTFAVGAIVGGVFVMKHLSGDRESYIYTCLSTLCAAAIYIIYALNITFELLLVSVFLFGFFISFSTAVWSAAIQRISPLEIKGRISSIRYIIISILVSIGMSLLSEFNESGFTTGAYFAFGLMLSLAAITVVFSLVDRYQDRLNSNSRVRHQ